MSAAKLMTNRVHLPATRVMPRRRGMSKRDARLLDVVLEQMADGVIITDGTGGCAG